MAGESQCKCPIFTARQLPFRVGVNFDAGEINAIVDASMAEKNEFQGAPGGIIGFKLTYWQVAC